MSTQSKVDLATLGWVRNEIDETLKQARLALESFLESPSDDTRLRFCITHLHQVVGTLLMVELDGAARLAKEAESLAEAMLADNSLATHDNLATLTRALVVLPDYLARLQAGQPDVPLRHLSILNELRTAHGVEALRELDLFSPDLSARPPRPEGEERLDEAGYAALARQLRPALQADLLAWLRDSRRQDALEDIGGLFEQLQVRAPAGPFEQLFWVAGGLIEALREGGLEASAERKKFFARLDQQLKKIIDGSERSQLRKLSEELVRGMLFELGTAASRGPRVSALRQAFSLNSMLGEAERGSVDLPTPQALQSVSTAMGKEIEIAQDLLATHFDPEHHEPTALGRLLEQLRKMGGILDMLGVYPLKSLVDELGATGLALQEGRVSDPQGASMPMAQALLLVESSARDFQHSAEGWKARLDDAIQRLHGLHAEGAAPPDSAGYEVQDAVLTESDFHQLVSVVAEEIGVNLAKVEEAVESFAAETGRPGLLDEVPGSLNQILGALQILGQERAAQFVDETRSHVEAIRESVLIPDAAVLDGLAVCVGTIGAYVEGLKAGRSGLDTLLDGARREMSTAMRRLQGPREPTALAASLRAHLESWMSTAAESSLAGAQTDLNELTELAHEQGQERIVRLAGEIRRLLQLVQEDPAALTDESLALLHQSSEALATMVGRFLTARAPAAAGAPARGTAAAPTPPPSMAAQSARAAAQAEEADPEIMLIFVEDARDVLNMVRKEFSAYRQNPDNITPLLEMRRGYHTIKGSGRMVGATDVAELAWAVENMLNKVRDGKIELQDSMLTLLERAQNEIARMVDALESGAPMGDVEALRLQAWSYAQGGAPETSTWSDAATAPTETGAPVEESASPLPEIDSTLFEIFSSEASGHLDTLRTEAARCRQDGTCLVSDPLFRSTHTLLGNARSLGLDMMAGSCFEVEKLLQHLRAQNLPMAAAHLDLIDSLETAVRALIEALQQGQHDAGDLGARFADIKHAAHAYQVATDGGAPPAASHTRPAPVAAAPSAPVSQPPPARRKPARPAAGDSAVSEQLDSELVEIFREEAVDIMATIDESLSVWRGRPDQTEAIHELKRALHTLKGGARMAGAMAMGELAHNTESLLGQIEYGRLEPGQDVLDLLDEAHDKLVTMLDSLRAGQSMIGAQGINARLQAAIGGQPSPESGLPETSDAVDKAPAPGTRAGFTPSPLADVAASLEEERRDLPETGDRQWPEPLDRRGQIRVNTRLLNNLVNFAGEVSISRSRMEQQIYGFRDNMSELKRNIARFREQIRELEIQSESQILYRTENAGSEGAGQGFDPLEFDRFSRLQQLSRQLAESLHDLSTIQGNLGLFVGEAETTLAQQARLNTDLQEGLMRTRMVSFSTQAGRLRHIVRTTARELGKRVELNLQGAEVELDRTVLDRMVGPFEHMIRNSIDHGIETDSIRRQRKKPAGGTVTIATVQEGGEIVIRFSDDGGGLNTRAIRQKAVERGLMAADANLTDDELIQFILMPGFSTAEKVTHLSGRGVGMDVVHSEVKLLGGTMAVDSRPGEGATFTIRLPLTLSITQALMIYVGDQQFAIPIASVSNIIEFPVDRIDELSVGDNPLLNYQDQVYPYLHLGARLGIPTGAARNGKKVPVLIARAGQREVAMQVDGLGGTREIVIKALGPQLVEIKGLAGATILGDGRVVLILDAPGLWFREDAIQVEHGAARKPAEPAHIRPVVMVVDDSLTVRKITGKHLTKHGMEVLTAKDGIDAWEQLRDRVPDIMLVDIEMPRMDGYELTSRIRSDERLRHIPIIMITSRAGAKHKQRALDIGVDDYMSKPYQEDELFRNIDKLLSMARGGNA